MKTIVCFETPINSQVSDGLHINLTRSLRKKNREATSTPPPTRKLPPFSPPLPSPPPLPLPSVEGGYGYFLEVHSLSIRS